LAKQHANELKLIKKSLNTKLFDLMLPDRCTNLHDVRLKHVKNESWWYGGQQGATWCQQHHAWHCLDFL